MILEYALAVLNQLEASKIEFFLTSTLNQFQLCIKRTLNLRNIYFLVDMESNSNSSLIMKSVM